MLLIRSELLTNETRRNRCPAHTTGNCTLYYIQLWAKCETELWEKKLFL